MKKLIIILISITLLSCSSINGQQISGPQIGVHYCPSNGVSFSCDWNPHFYTNN